ncbi:MAG TPA: tRNA (adenosine(37)-N6)-threonylcarbamoyltransferase complex dimerization subunit type 1 TsaB [Vicinamibacteria bacterium]|nr:tRNA (adenosine(37)-N6)-threonylcarbamoyltransferase complex dimerization subunit type 1 TsaB [Vicinamibacteria bacterium]
MRVLAVDTTGAHGSVGIVEDGELLGLIGTRETSPRHAESLLPTIDHLLRLHALGLEQIDGFAVAVGPGSFTGLRIGIAAVAGLSFAAGKPAAGISALEATAHRFRHVEGLVVPLIEAYRGEVYGAAYRARRGILHLEVEPSCAAAPAFLASLPEPPLLVAGTALLRHREAIRAHAREAFLADSSFFLADEIARLGGARMEAGEAAALGSLAPLYVRRADAEIET